MIVHIMDFSVLYRKLNTAKVMAHNPTLIGTVLGVKFYEHPTRGDEAGLIAVDLQGQAWLTDWYDLPRDCDLFTR